VYDVRVRRIRIVAWQVRYENRIWGCFILAPELSDEKLREVQGRDHYSPVGNIGNTRRLEE
jgi:hypothetical protein